MTDLRQAAHNKRVDDVIRVAIAAAWDKLDDKPEQEPTPWRDMVVVSLVREGINKHRARELADHFAAPPQQQAEPVAWMSLDRAWMWSDYSKAIAAVANIPTLTLIPLYAAPAQRPWVDLTDKDWEWVADKKETSLDTFAHGAAWAADQLRERNT